MTTRVSPPDFSQPHVGRPALSRRSVLALAIAMAGASDDGAAQTPAQAQPASAAGQNVVRGAGSTLAARIYGAWAQRYQAERGVTVQYEGVGSTEGVRRATAREVMFGATDVRMDRAALDKAGLVQFPTVATAIVPIVNLPGIGRTPLQLDAATLAAIFDGRIAQWDDARIAALNPQLALPRLAVQRVVRAESSGTTAAFTRYFHLAGAQTSVQPSATVAWPGHVKTAHGTDGMRNTVAEVTGSIGYLSMDRANGPDISAVSLKNAAGHVVPANIETVQAAINGAGLRDKLDADLLNAPGMQSWPLAELTYIVVPAAPATRQEVEGALRFFAWAFTVGDTIVKGTGFVPLPVSVQRNAYALFTRVRPKDGSVLNLLI